jgi:hypothetical protein
MNKEKRDRTTYVLISRRRNDIRFVLQGEAFLDRNSSKLLAFCLEEALSSQAHKPHPPVKKSRLSWKRKAIEVG